MTDKTVPIIVSTGEVVGIANISPPDENGKMYASINITEPKIVEQHNGLVEVVLEENTRTHDAFLNGYSEEDEELYE